jgi:hypothetical protein
MGRYLNSCEFLLSGTAGSLEGDMMCMFLNSGETQLAGTASSLEGDIDG